MTDMPESISLRSASFLVRNASGAILTRRDPTDWYRGAEKLVGVIDKHFTIPRPDANALTAACVLYLAGYLTNQPLANFAHNDIRTPARRRIVIVKRKAGARGRRELRMIVGGKTLVAPCARSHCVGSLRGQIPTRGRDRTCQR